MTAGKSTVSRTDLVLPLHPRSILFSAVALDFTVFLNVVHESGSMA